jgi:sugar O-acyltransferase (sialic acid O-acetyltransferase NeuD family)
MDINASKKEWNLLGYIDETVEKQGKTINGHIVLGNIDWLKKNKKYPLWTVCAIGNPKDKFHALSNLRSCNIRYANLIHPTVSLNPYVEFGVGNIICWHSFLSVNTKIGNNVCINPGCTIGHDTVIDDYSSLYWNVTLAGNVRIHKGCEIGSKSVIIPRKTVGEWSIIGAGAVVTKNIPENCLALGVPAKPIRNLPNHKRA